MKAAVFLGNRKCAVEDTATAALTADEVLLELEGCGICASNLPVWEGRPWFEYPLAAGAPGHEPWGRVAALGDSVTGFELGDRVTGLSYRAYAEYDVARAAQLLRIPAQYDGRAFPGEALACASNVFARSAVERGVSVAVVGAGFIGGLLIQLAVAADACVVAYSQRQWSRDQAIAQGAAAARALGQDLAEDAADSGAYPRVIECTGTQAGLDAATRLVASGGRLVIAGYHQDGLRNIDMQAWNWKGIDVANAHERDPARYLQGLRAALAAMERREIDPWPLYTHAFPLTELDAAFRLMRQRPEGFTKALLTL